MPTFCKEQNGQKNTPSHFERINLITLLIVVTMLGA